MILSRNEAFPMLRWLLGLGCVCAFPFALVAAPLSAVNYRPDGQLLAVGGRGEVQLVDPLKAHCVRKLPNQTRQVTSLAFSNDGKMLAVASGKAGQSGEVRLYAVADGNDYALKHTITAHKDLIYALAFSADGKMLASAGYDRLIQLWNVDTGKSVRSLADHSDTIYGLAFQPNGKLLVSVAADRAVKVWDSQTGVRLFTLSEATDWLYALAWHPDGKRLVAGGVDKSIRVWEVAPDGGKLLQSVFAHDAAVARLAFSGDGKTLFSLGEDRVIKAWDSAKMVESRVFPAQPEAVFGLAARADGKQLALARFDGVGLLLDVAAGTTTPIQAAAAPPAHERYPVVNEVEPADSPRTGYLITPPRTIKGIIGRFGDADFARLDVKAGESLGVEIITAPLSSKLDAVVTLHDEQGKVIAEARDGLLAYTFDKAGRYAIGVRDREYRGGPDMPYVLNIGPIPMITSVYPLSVPRGQASVVQLRGVFLDQPQATIRVPADAAVGSRLPVPLTGVAKSAPLGKAEVVIGEFAERVGPGELTVPGSGHGIIAQPGTVETWNFRANKGQRLVIEVHARRFGSPLDSLIEVCDSNGVVLNRHTLRCVARVFTTFRDNDSVTTGIRLESWNELAMADYVLIDNELMRIDQLPKNPDDDCRFAAVAGRRVGYFGTTPTHHSNGSSVYKVELHPPGSTFPNNGMPVFQLPYRNDDGQPEIHANAGKDSHLFFDAPADGVYQVRVRDARGMGRADFAYRLTIRAPKPDYSIAFNPQEPKVWKGNGVPLTVTAQRFDGFTGPIELRIDNLPPGFEAPPTRIEAEQMEAVLPLWAPANAAIPPGTAPLKIVARALIDGQEVQRESIGKVPQLIEPGDLVTTTSSNEVVIRPGQEARLVVNIERRNGFTGRVPLDVKGLPYGVRVLNIGLNGILVIPNQTSREIVLYAEPWVQPMTQPIVVLSRREGKGSEHVAKPVMLRVAKE